MRNLCIIPARGGSKRIPRKNIKEFIGKPIIAYAIELAIKSELFDEIMVSTDDIEIANIAISYGAKVPFLRNPNTADDFATTLEVLKEVVGNYDNLNMTFDSICCIYPTAVLANVEDIKIGLSKLEQHNLILPVTRFSYPPQRCYIIHENEVKYKNPEFELSRSQDLEVLYHDAAQWYWYKLDNMKFKNAYPLKGFVILDNDHVQDIDNIEDWRMAELKYKSLKNISN